MFVESVRILINFPCTTCVAKKIISFLFSLYCPTATMARREKKMLAYTLKVDDSKTSASCHLHAVYPLLESNWKTL